MNDGLILMVVGMAVVFAGLSLMAIAVVLLRRFLAEPPPPPSIKKEERSEKTDAESRIDAQLIAILTAAATAALGVRVRVYRVGFVEDEWSADHSWIQQARSELHTSHRPRY
jgi:Na+-transporting methylmalonyl-CoA/oxaloacetate decarboxylase gamma subunit